MRLSETFALSITSLVTNKLRASLTILGIVVGIFSIILIMTILTMLQNTIESGFSMLGQNTFQVQKYPAIRMGGPQMGRKYWNRKDITIEDFYRLKESLTDAKYVAAELHRGGRLVKFQNKETNPNVSLVGITQEAVNTNEWFVEQGRSITNTDVDRAMPYILLGQDVVDLLFENVNPIGQIVKVDNRPLRVIGIMERKGQMFGQSRDNIIIIPISVFVSMYGKKDRSVNITVMSHSKMDYNEVIEAATGHMRTIRKVPPGEENDFEIFSNESLLAEINKITKYVEIGAMVVSFIALLAAGVGIMNIMLVSVTERTREIGIRKAVGAKKSSILTQFLFEAITLCLVGGIIGIILGVGFGNLAGSLLKAEATIPFDWVFIGLAICVLVGVIFGTYPAYKAANLDPIEALRYE